MIDSAEHPFDIAQTAYGRASTVVAIPIANWNDALTPWPAPGFYEDEPWFGGHGDETLKNLLNHTIPKIEAELGMCRTTAQPALHNDNAGSIRRAICGYSLGGLFALYAFVNDARFDACASISGSLWYQGWMDHLRETTEKLVSSGSVDPDRPGKQDRYAFLSVGTKECKSGLPLFRCVEDNMHASADLLRAVGCRVDAIVGPGNHMQHIPERFEAALAELDEFLARP